MSSNYYNGTKHYFGTKNSDENPDVFILPNKGQTLNISGASFSPIGVSVSNLTTTDTTASTSKITGSLRSSGGAGISGDLYADKINAVNTTDATSKTTGSIQTLGGIGCSKNIYCTDLNASGSIITGTPLSGTYGGTGVNNGARTITTTDSITIGATATTKQLMYTSSANNITGLATANNGTLITSADGTPSISSTLPTQVQDTITRTGTITSGTWNGSVITGTYGGTGVNNGSRTITTTDSITIGATTTANQLFYTSSANNLTGLVTGNNGVLITSGAGLPSISSTLPTAVQGNITSLGNVSTSTTYNTTNATDASSVSTGSIITSGGIGCSKRIYATDLTVVNSNYTMIYNNGSISIPNSTYQNPYEVPGAAGTVVQAGTDTSGTTLGAITINRSGLYTITYAANFSAHATGGRGASILHTSGTFTGLGQHSLIEYQAVTSGTNTRVCGGATIPLVAGNVIKCVIFQNSGGALDSDRNLFCVAKHV